MTQTVARRPRPYVLVFQLRKDTRVGKKKIPAALASSLCFFYRSDHEPLAAELDAMPEVEVSEADAELMFAAVEGTIAENELQEELYSDAELAAGAQHTEKSGFHAGGTFASCREALERGGFVVEEIADELTTTNVKLSHAQAQGRLIQALERHLDLTSLSLVLAAVSGGVDLPGHADAATSVLLEAFEKVDRAAFTSQVLAASSRWQAELRDTLIVLAAYAAGGQAGAAAAPLRALVEALGAPSDPVAAAWLAERSRG